jgi:predicted GNAT superfamily acetyltransferase
VVYEFAPYVGPPPARASILAFLRYRVLDDSRTRPTAPATRINAGALAEEPTEITVRPIFARAECQACVALQHEIWGDDDAAPASVLQVVAHVGGIVAGAFAADGELLGFVFGLPALMHGTIAHWSHVLGVRESARNGGVGRMLKEYQRAELARRGIARMYWTYDPLVAKNAHLNLNLLGARVVEYVRDMYGTTASPLHHGLATDRLIVVCDTGPRPSPRGEPAWRALERCPVLTAEPRPGDAPASMDDGARPHTLLLEIPADFQLLAVQASDRAERWHAATRAHFEWALLNGYTVTGLHREPVTSRAFYVLEHRPQGAA